MRYSYAWDVTPADLPYRESSSDAVGVLADRYVRVTGHADPVQVDEVWAKAVPESVATQCRARKTHFTIWHPADASGPVRWVGFFIWIRPGAGEDADVETWGRSIVERLGRAGSMCVVRVVGRVSIKPKKTTGITMRLRAEASRFTGASIAGLVVGAMGVFVFTVALRHWLGERRTAREAA
jgi:hypothetical protein